MARPLPFLLLCVAACGPRTDGNNARAATAPATVPVTTASAAARQH